MAGFVTYAICMAIYITTYHEFPTKPILKSDFMGKATIQRNKQAINLEPSKICVHPQKRSKSDINHHLRLLLVGLFLFEKTNRGLSPMTSTSLPPRNDGSATATGRGGSECFQDRNARPGVRWHCWLKGAKRHGGT